MTSKHQRVPAEVAPSRAPSVENHQFGSAVKPSPEIGDDTEWHDEADAEISDLDSDITDGSKNSEENDPGSSDITFEFVSDLFDMSELFTRFDLMSSAHESSLDIFAHRDIAHTTFLQFFGQANGGLDGSLTHGLRNSEEEGFESSDMKFEFASSRVDMAGLFTLPDWTFSFARKLDFDFFAQHDIGDAAYLQFPERARVPSPESDGLMLIGLDEEALFAVGVVGYDPIDPYTFLA